MSTVALSGNDTTILNGRVLNDLADQNAVELTFPNEIATVKTGKNGNSIFSLNELGQNADVKIRVIRGSSDDKYLNGLISLQQANFAGTVLISGEFIKKVGDGQGNVTNDTYILIGGIMNKNVEAKSNVEGDTEQSVSIYSLKFARAPRALT